MRRHGEGDLGTLTLKKKTEKADSDVRNLGDEAQPLLSDMKLDEDKAGPSFGSGSGSESHSFSQQSFPSQRTPEQARQGRNSRQGSSEKPRSGVRPSRSKRALGKLLRSKQSFLSDDSQEMNFEEERLKLAGRFMKLALERRDISLVYDVFEEESNLARVIHGYPYRTALASIILLHLTMILWECQSLWFALFVKGGILACYCMDIFLHWKAFGSQYYFDKKWQMGFACMTMLQVLFFAVHALKIFFSGSVHQCLLVGISQVIRPYLLIAKMKPLRQPLATILYTLYSALPIMLLALVAIVFYAVLGTSLFNSMQCEGYDPEEDNFNTFWPSAIAMYILTTTENFPFVSEPAFSERPAWAYPYFFSFVCLFTLVLLPLLLAQVLEAYRFNHRQRVQRGLTKARQGLLVAYYVATATDNEVEEGGSLTPRHNNRLWNLLGQKEKSIKEKAPFASDQCSDEEPTLMTFEVFMKLTRKVNPNLHEDYIEGLLSLIGANWEQKVVTAQAFLRLPEIADQRILEKEDLGSYRGVVPWFQYICQRVVDHVLFYYLSVILTLSFLGMALLWEQTITLKNEGCRLGIAESSACPLIFVQVWVERILVLLYGVEILIRYGAERSRYWKNKWNIYDFSIFLCSAISEILSIFMQNFFITHMHFGDIMELPRCLRVLRLVVVLPVFSNLVDIISPCVQIIGELLSLYLCIAYSFAAIGMMLFSKVVPTPDDDDHVFARYNFEDFGGAFMCLVYLSINNNWNDLMYHNIKQTGGRVYATYFVSYMVICSTIILDIIVGVVLEAVAIAKKQKQKSDQLNAVDEEHPFSSKRGLRYKLSQVSSNIMFVDDFEISNDEMIALEDAVHNIELRLMQVARLSYTNEELDQEIQKNFGKDDSLHENNEQSYGSLMSRHSLRR